MDICLCVQVNDEKKAAFKDCISVSGIMKIYLAQDCFTELQKSNGIA